jgi:hypothetical protein
VEGKGQTRNWLIIAPLPAGKYMANVNNIIKKAYDGILYIPYLKTMIKG